MDNKRIAEVLIERIERHKAKYGGPPPALAVSRQEAAELKNSPFQRYVVRAALNHIPAPDETPDFLEHRNLLEFNASGGATFCGIALVVL